ncbi:MAG TPA: GPW/gp25 family protein [Candidatus Binataceae bacterium]|jgi:phage baseplate assembly protein W|nr:GPW/gp25 family protein [Candidatus Binataceae bacterium]
MLLLLFQSAAVAAESLIPSPNAIAVDSITSADWSMMLDSTAGGAYAAGLGQVVQGLADIEQCLMIILTTPPGSDMLRPDFACDLFQFIDQPITVALPALVAEVAAKIAKFEPRIKLLSVTAQPASADYSAFDVTVTWQLKTPGAQAQSTTVTIGSSIAN